jgi:CRP-like cAMP-binding protein
VLLVGEANLVVSLPDGSEYQDVGHLSAGAIIGELAALLNEPRTATLVAAKTCQLLRFEHDHFLRLFEEVPAFGLAVSRMLAERMRDTFFDKLSLFSEIMPRSITLPASDLSRMRSYMAKYYATAIKNVLRKHQLIVQRTLPRYQTQFSLSDEEQTHWFRLFNVTDRERVTPFTYYTMSGTMILMKIVEGVGVNFKNLLHLKSVMRFNAAGRILEAGKPYLVSIELHDIVQLREDRVALVTVTSMYDQDKVLIQTFKDFFIILNLEPEYFNILRANKGFGRHDASEFMGLSERAPHLASADRVNQVVIQGNRI